MLDTFLTYLTPSVFAIGVLIVCVLLVLYFAGVFDSSPEEKTINDDDEKLNNAVIDAIGA